MATTTRPRGAARREALLEAVLEIVAASGADSVTHRRVAEVAELPLASTTYWFSSKEHLLTAALELAAERDIARLTASVTRPNDDHDTTDSIEAIVSLVLDPCEDNLRTSRGSLIATYTLLLEAARRPALREIAARWTDAYLDAARELLQRAGSADPPGDAKLLVAAADGLLIEELSRGRNSNLRPRMRRLVAALIAAP
jgi:TetR/AcrR family transcriptional regulator, regulator of biofilm formation and stress response